MAAVSPRGAARRGVGGPVAVRVIEFPESVGASRDMPGRRSAVVTLASRGACRWGNAGGCDFAEGRRARPGAGDRAADRTNESAESDGAEESSDRWGGGGRAGKRRRGVFRFAASSIPVPGHRGPVGGRKALPC